MAGINKKVHFSENLETIHTIPYEDRSGTWVSDSLHFKRRAEFLKPILSEKHRKNWIQRWMKLGNCIEG